MRDRPENERGGGILPAFVPVFIGSGAMQSAAGMLGTVIPLALAYAAVSPSLIGQVAAGYAAGFALGCILAPEITRRLGPSAALAAFVLTQTACSLLLVVLPFGAWIPVRTLMGFCGAGTVVIIESWVNLRSPPGRRGQVFGIYNLAGRLATVGGQLAAALPWALAPWAMAGPAALYLACFAFVRGSISGDRVTAAVPRRPPLLSFLHTPAIPALAIIYVGAVGSTLIAVAPAWGVIVGMTPSGAALLAVAVQAGSFVLQWPITWLSDKVDRSLVILAAMVVTGLSALALLTIGTGQPLAVVLVCGVMGGVSLPVYAMAYAAAFDRQREGNSVSLSSGLLFNWAIGSVMGPLLAGEALGRLGPDGLFLFVAALAWVGAAILTVLIRREARLGSGPK